MVVARQQNARVKPDMARQTAGFLVFKPHAVNDVPAGICRDHRTDVPFSNVLHVVLYNSTH
eukprot:5691056-Amphidinium_carterae.1